MFLLLNRLIPVWSSLNRKRTCGNSLLTDNYKKPFARKKSERFYFAFSGAGLLLYCVNADLFAAFVFALKLDIAVYKGKEGIVGTDAHIVAGMNAGAALTDKDVAGQYKLTVAPFNAESFGFGIAPVAGGTHSLFMRKKLNVDF